MHTSTAEGGFVSFIKILSKAMGVFQLVLVGFGAGQDVGRLVLAPHDKARLRGSVFKLQKYSPGEGCTCSLTLANLESSFKAGLTTCIFLR